MKKIVTNMHTALNFIEASHQPRVAVEPEAVTTFYAVTKPKPYSLEVPNINDYASLMDLIAAHKMYLAEKGEDTSIDGINIDSDTGLWFSNHTTKNKDVYWSILSVTEQILRRIQRTID